jgi:alanine or glycine:cation symporter, AGCS family
MGIASLPPMTLRESRIHWLLLILCGFIVSQPLSAQEAPAAGAAKVEKSLDEKINDLFEPATKAVNTIVFFNIYNSSEKTAEGKPVLGVPFILIWLGGSALFLTLFFRFINLRAFGLALRTVRGKYSKSDDPGEITHFQALSSAVSATVGLGNIAGVAIAISMGGPGAMFWIIVMGLLGMTSKFAECTLGLKYRHIDKNGKVLGGPMLYLSRGLADRGLGALGRTLAVIFAVLCIGGAMGGGNMFQINQAASQFVNVTGGAGGFTDQNRWLFGLVIAVLVGLVIIGGITRIAQVTSKLVPFMTITYVLGCLVVIFEHSDKIGATVGLVLSGAFDGQAVAGGAVGVMLIGIRRAVFSNEAGVGSAPIAHAAAKTKYAASEGLVALLEPFIDTVVICSMTAFVVICTGDYLNSDKDGITMTSESFSSVIPWFKYVLSAAVILFALSTLISWSYYGLQASKFLFGKSNKVDITYKIVFCLVIVVGAAMAPGNVIDFSDAALLAMCFPNLIGVFILLPVVKSELAKFLSFSKRIDAGEDHDTAHAHVSSQGH